MSWYLISNTTTYKLKQGTTIGPEFSSDIGFPSYPNAPICTIKAQLSEEYITFRKTTTGNGIFINDQEMTVDSFRAYHADSFKVRSILLHLIHESLPEQSNTISSTTTPE